MPLEKQTVLLFQLQIRQNRINDFVEESFETCLLMKWLFCMIVEQIVHIFQYIHNYSSAYVTLPVHT